MHTFVSGKSLHSLPGKVLENSRLEVSQTLFSTASDTGVGHTFFSWSVTDSFLKLCRVQGK